MCSADMMGMTVPTAEVAVPVEGHLGGSMEPTGEAFFDRCHCTQQRLDTKKEIITNPVDTSLRSPEIRGIGDTECREQVRLKSSEMLLTENTSFTFSSWRAHPVWKTILSHWTNQDMISTGM